MKTKSILNITRAPRSALLSAGATLLAALLLSSHALASSPPCKHTANLALHAARADAAGEYVLAIAKASTLTGAAKNAAEQQALTEFREREELAREQREERYELCNLLNETRYNPQINPANFRTPQQTAANPNPYFPLIPGRVLRYEGATPEGQEVVEVRITRDTRQILGVTCIIVRDTVWLDGNLVEDTYDWMAQDNQGNVWYFGERVTDYDEDGLVSSIDGSFEAGVDGAKPGILMKAQPMVGNAYRQEFALSEAEDAAKVLSINASVTVPYGSFNMNCVKTRDFTPLDPEASDEHKFYAPGIGNVLNVKVDTGERVELVSVTME